MRPSGVHTGALPRKPQHLDRVSSVPGQSDVHIIPHGPGQAMFGLRKHRVVHEAYWGSGVHVHVVWFGLGRPTKGNRHTRHTDQFQVRNGGPDHSRLQIIHIPFGRNKGFRPGFDGRCTQETPKAFHQVGVLHSMFARAMELAHGEGHWLARKAPDQL